VDHPLIEFVGEIGDHREVSLPGRRRCPAVPDRLARAVRPGDDRSHGLRHAGVAYDCGSVPEVIEDGLTGFIVRDEDEAVRRCDAFHRSTAAWSRALRDWFSATAMARRYLDLYDTKTAAAPDAERLISHGSMTGFDPARRTFAA
jgi:hypothetical protein